MIPAGSETGMDMALVGFDLTTGKICFKADRARVIVEEYGETEVMHWSGVAPIRVTPAEWVLTARLEPGDDGHVYQVFTDGVV